MVSFIQATLSYVVYINPSHVRAVMPYLEARRVDQPNGTYKMENFPCADRSVIIFGDGEEDSFLVRGGVYFVIGRLQAGK